MLTLSKYTVNRILPVDGLMLCQGAVDAVHAQKFFHRCTLTLAQRGSAACWRVCRVCEWARSNSPHICCWCLGLRPLAPDLGTVRIALPGYCPYLNPAERWTLTRPANPMHPFHQGAHRPFQKGACSGSTALLYPACNAKNPQPMMSSSEWRKLGVLNNWVLNFVFPPVVFSWPQQRHLAVRRTGARGKRG
jgi:hypothetical protein